MKPGDQLFDGYLNGSMTGVKFLYGQVWRIFALEAGASWIQQI